MCISAEASFGVSAILLPAGAYCLRSAIRKDPSAIPLALVPFFFSLQQFFEGLVWVGLEREQTALVSLGGLGFLFFALSFWPVWIPLSTFLAERHPLRRKVIGGVLIYGLAWSALLYVPILLQPDRIAATVVDHSIQYDYPNLSGPDETSPDAQRLVYLVYFAMIAIPFLVSSLIRENVLVVILAFAAVITQFLFWYAFVSVWCFFAALASICLCYSFRRM